MAEIRACERMKESKKLLHLTVFDGERERCILSGIAKWFAPEDLIGKKVGIVANLAPRPDDEGQVRQRGHDRRRRHRYPRRLRRRLLSRTASPRAPASTEAGKERTHAGSYQRYPGTAGCAVAHRRLFRAVPAAAVAMAILCNAHVGRRPSPSSRWATASSPSTPPTRPSILCFAGVRFMLGALLVWLCGAAAGPAGRCPCPAAATWRPAAPWACGRPPPSISSTTTAVALLTGAHGRHPQQHPELSGRHPGPFPLRQGRPHDPRPKPWAACWASAACWWSRWATSARRQPGWASPVHAASPPAVLARWRAPGTRPSPAGPTASRSPASTWGWAAWPSTVLGFALGGSLRPQSMAAGIPVLLILALHLGGRAMCCGPCS